MEERLPLDITFQQGCAALRAGKLDDAVSLLRRVLQIEPTHLVTLNLLGAALIQLRQFPEAEHHLRQAHALQPSSDATLHNRGIALKALSRLAEALESFSQALQINAAVVETWNNRGTVFSDLERYDEALHDFEKAIEINPQYAEAYCNKGKALLAVNRSLEALAAFDKALALKSDLAVAWLGRGNVLLALERHEEAICDFEKSIKLNPQYAEAYCNKGKALAALNRYAEAFSAFEQTLGLMPDLAVAWLGCGNVLFAVERHHEAIAAYDKALTLNTRLKMAWIGRRNAHAALNQNGNRSADAYGLSITEFIPRDGSPLQVKIGGKSGSQTVKLVEDQLVSPFVLLRHAWQSEELEFAKRICTDVQSITLIDVGANMGLFSRQLLVALPAIAEVFAYEPEEQNYACLVHNLEPFELKVHFIKAALSNKAGDAQFYLDPTNSGNFSLSATAMPGRYILSSVETKNVAEESSLWIDAGRPVFYKSDTQGFDELIATTIRPEFWSCVRGGIMEVWSINKPRFDSAVFASILDSFPNKIFLANADTQVSEERVSTADVLKYALTEDHGHRDLGFWR